MYSIDLKKMFRCERMHCNAANFNLFSVLFNASIRAVKCV